MKNRIRTILMLLGVLMALAMSACSAQEAAAPQGLPQENPIQENSGQPSVNEQPPTGNPLADVPAPDAQTQTDANTSEGNIAAAPSGTGNLTRSYTFTDTGKQIPYRVFVPSTWDAGQQLPLVVILHDRWEDENAPFEREPEASRGIVARLAEQYKFIVVAPLGYARNGGYGAAQFKGSGDPGGDERSQGGPGGQPPARGEGAGGPPPDDGAPGDGQGGPGEPQGQAPQGTPPAGPDGQGHGPDQEAENLTEQEKTNLETYSEQDVLNVLSQVTQEFNVDSTKVFLMGSGMGANGVMHLATKYPDRWAAIAASNGGFDVSTYETSLPALKIKGAFFVQSTGQAGQVNPDGKAAGQNDPAGQGSGQPRPALQTADEMIEKLQALGIDTQLVSVENARPSEAWYTVAEQIFAYFDTFVKQ